MVQYLTATCGVQGDWGLCLLTSAARGGRLNVLEWARSEGYDFEEHIAAVTRSAAERCSVAALNWLRQHYNVVYETEHLITAISTSPQSLEACQYLVSTGCQVTLEACEAAARLADIAILQWFHEIGACEHTPEICTAAAEDSRFQTLRWLHEEVHCSWDAFQVAWMACAPYRPKTSESVRVLQYLHEQGENFADEQLAELLNRSVRLADRQGDLVCAKWLRAHGALWPAVLSCEFDNDPGDLVHGDWPEVAVSWCRAEGCTAPLWSEVQANDE